MKFVRLAPKALLLVLATVFLAAASFAQDIAPTVRLTVTPGIPNPIYIKTQPNAVCALYTNGIHDRDNKADSREQFPENDAQHTLQLYADQVGTIHFNAQPPVSSSEFFARDKDVVHILLQCQVQVQVDDKVTTTTYTYPIELRASFFGTRDFPAPSPLPKPVGTIRPALRGEQLTTLTNEELLAEGYPLRPDPIQAPDAYANWLSAVSEPVILVSPQTVSLPGIVHSPTVHQNYTPNWSGFELLSSNVIGGVTLDPYDWVAASWFIPSVTGEAIWLDHSALWIGLDSPGGNGPDCPGCEDLVQDGTEQDVTAGGVSMSMPMPWWFSTYHAWFEIVPNEAMQSTNLMVTAGDMMYSQVWIANASGPPTPTGNSAFFYVQDLTTHAVFISPPEPLNLSPPGFSGQTAEWIMERPVFGFSPSDIILPDLANYDVAFMGGPEAQTASGKYVGWNSSANWQITMDGCTIRFALFTACTLAPTDVLSTAAPAIKFNGGIQFNWHGFH